MKFCPIKRQTNRARSGTGAFITSETIFMYCLENECAFYNEDKNECAILTALKGPPPLQIHDDFKNTGPGIDDFYKNDPLGKALASKDAENDTEEKE